MPAGRLEAQAAASSAVAAENDELRGKLLKALESIDIREQHTACQVSPQGEKGLVMRCIYSMPLVGAGIGVNHIQS